MQLVDLPEEILFVILEYVIVPLHRSFIPRVPPLLTCRTIHRIGLPILYRTLLVPSHRVADLIQRTLLAHPTLVRHVRNVYSTAKTMQFLPVLHAIGLAKGSLQTLDFSLDTSWMIIHDGESNVGELFAAVPVRRLAVRLGTLAFLPRDCELAFANALSQAVECWPNLV
jgi:hypothetical protein